jgi:hypothetical protein
MRLTRSEFFSKPAEYLAEAEDKHEIIELRRYNGVGHVIVPLDLEGATSFDAYVYENIGGESRSFKVTVARYEPSADQCRTSGLLWTDRGSRPMQWDHPDMP